MSVQLSLTLDNRDFSSESEAQVQLSEQRLGVARPSRKATPSALLPSRSQEVKTKQPNKGQGVRLSLKGMENLMHAWHVCFKSVRHECKFVQSSLFV